MDLKVEEQQNSDRIRIKFENELREKLTQKVSCRVREELIIINQCKYFDQQQNGYLFKEEFIKALTRCGIVFPTKQFENLIFNIYDVNKDGKIYYQDFSNQIWLSDAFKNSLKIDTVRNRAQYIAPSKQHLHDLFHGILHKMKQHLTYGVYNGNSYLRLFMCFKRLDWHNEVFIKQPPMNLAFREFKFEINEAEADQLFMYLKDQDTQLLNYRTLILKLRGNIVEHRKKQVENVWDHLLEIQKKEGDSSDSLKHSTILKNFDKMNHPKSVKEYLAGGEVDVDVFEVEFQSDLYQYTIWLGINDIDHFCEDEIYFTKDQFIDFFSFLSAQITDDNEFREIFYGVFGITPKIQKYQKNVKKVYDNKLDKEFDRNTELLLSFLRKRIARRGAKGFLQLYRVLKEMDDDQDNMLTIQQLKTCFKETRLELNNHEFEQLISQIDSNQTNSIKIEDIMVYIQGEINEKRFNLFNQIFSKVDVDQDNLISIQDLKYFCLTHKHPYVVSGKKEEASIKEELNDTIKIYKEIFQDQNPYSFTRQQFVHYMRNYSASIFEDRDINAIFINMFQLTSLNVPKTQNSYAGNLTQNQNPSYVPDHKKIYIKNIYNLQDQNDPNDKLVTQDPYGVFEIESKEQFQTQYRQNMQQNQFEQNRPSNKLEYKQIDTNHHILQVCRAQLRKLSLIELLKLQNTFQDKHNQTRNIDVLEFLGIFKEKRIQISDLDLRQAFNLLLHDVKSQKISYQEFFQVIVEQMNQNRYQEVLNAFKQFSQNQNQVLQDDLYQNYRVHNHPDVQKGQVQQDVIAGQFYDSFDLHLIFQRFITGKMPVQKLRGKKITIDEFISYYNYVSFIIQDDNYFNSILRKCWNNEENNTRYKK